MSTTTSLHLGHGEQPPEVRIHTYPHRPPIGSVEIDGASITIAATNPDDLWRLGRAFLRAGNDLYDAGEQYKVAMAHAITLADIDGAA